MATINLGSLKFNWTGAYNSSTTYAVDDVVSSGGNSYVCIQAHSNQAVGDATAYWNIMSLKGTNGTNGTDLSSLLSTRGDLVFKNASALARLPKGTSGQVLGQGANDPTWVNGSSSTLTTQGDILYRDGSGLQRLAKGTAGQVLQMNSGATAPEYATPSGGVSEGFSAYDMSGTASGVLVIHSTKVNTNGNYNTSNGRYTAPSAGKYYFYGFVMSGSAGLEFYFKENNNAISGVGTDYGYTPNTVTMGTINIILDLAQGDYVTLAANNSVYGNYIGFGGFKLY